MESLKIVLTTLSEEEMQKGYVEFNPEKFQIITNPYVRKEMPIHDLQSFRKYITLNYTVRNSNLPEFLVANQNVPRVKKFLDKLRLKILIFFGNTNIDMINKAGVTCLRYSEGVWVIRTYRIHAGDWNKSAVAVVFNMDVNMANNKIANYLELKSIANTPGEDEIAMVNISKFLTNSVCEYLLPDMIPYLGQDIWVRKTVAEKLEIVQRNLSKIDSSYKLKVVYGYRHPEVQKKWFNKIKNELRLKHVNMDESSLDELANTMVAHPETAGHPTGGAVDLTITTPTGDLDMGTIYADFSDPGKFKMFSDKITKKQMNNRMFLHNLMIEQEFTPYYGEWWHYSYGDKEWAWFYKKPNALYEQIEFSTQK